MLLLSRYLLPVAPGLVEVTPVDYPLPPAPELMDARLGDDRFALSVSMEIYQPAIAMPPRNLPTLLAEPVWSVGNGCGTGDDQFDRPHGVAIDPVSGWIYVADSANRRIVQLDPNAGGVTAVVTSDLFQEPADVAIGPDGRLLVLDAVADTHLLAADMSSGTVEALPVGTSFYRPRGLSVDAINTLVIADPGSARVVLLDAGGGLLGEYGGPRSLLGAGQPVDAVAADGQIWAVTPENGRLWRLDVLGSLPIMHRTSSVDGPQLAALPAGDFLVSDPGGRTVLYLGSNGQPLARLGYEDQFLVPTGLAVSQPNPGGDVTLAVADTGRCTVSLWRIRVN
jgi:DNA-binding beta-propeller fold protein YncE